MILQHQPTVFKNLSIKVACSSLKDGMMKLGEETAKVIENRQRFLQKAGSSIDSATLLRVGYGDDVTYERMLDVGKGELGKGMLANADIEETDALFTNTPGQALFLPIADCGGAVLFDAKRKVLGLAHLGRHATMDGLAESAVKHMETRYGTHPSDIHAWISPAISGASYWLHTFDAGHMKEWQPHIAAHESGWHVDLQGYNIDRLVEAGVTKNQIERSPINTATDPNYPSHYAYATLGQPQKAGRFAVAACIQ